MFYWLGLQNIKALFHIQQFGLESRIIILTNYRRSWKCLCLILYVGMPKAELVVLFHEKPNTFYDRLVKKVISNIDDEGD